MSDTVYDRHAQFYVDFVDRGRATADAQGYDHLLARTEAHLGAALAGARVLDLCCGEGYVGRWLVGHGAGEVVGVDLSHALIEMAKARADSERLSYVNADAGRLDEVIGHPFDVAVCHMALMDVADHRALFAGVRRVLKAGGPFVLSLLHPCFMAPCHVTDAPPLLLDDDGQAVAAAVRRYNTEGYWNSGGDGVRGHMGSYHRTIATYVNDLIAAGFRLEAMEEMLAGAGPYGAPTAQALAAEIPSVLLLAATVVN